MDNLPVINASLNAISAVLLATGFVFIRRKKISLHRLCMQGAFAVSIAFLVGYLMHKWFLHQSTGSFNTAFAGDGAIRPVYYSVLLTHVVLAAVLPFLATITLIRGRMNMVVKHRRLARITLPIWMYVSVTGVLIYFMLYIWYPVI